MLGISKNKDRSTHDYFFRWSFLANKATVAKSRPKRYSIVFVHHVCGWSMLVSEMVHLYNFMYNVQHNLNGIRSICSTASHVAIILIRWLRMCPVTLEVVGTEKATIDFLLVLSAISCSIHPTCWWELDLSFLSLFFLLIITSMENVGRDFRAQLLIKGLIELPPYPLPLSALTTIPNCGCGFRFLLCCGIISCRSSSSCWCIKFVWFQNPNALPIWYKSR